MQKQQNQPRTKAPRKKKGKGKKKTQGNRGLGGQQLMQTAKAYGVLDTRLTQALKFGAAAPNNEFPEGGCRLAGDLPNALDDTIGIYGGSGYTAAVAAVPGTAGGQIGWLVSPTATSATAGWGAGGNSLFGASASTVSLIAQFFRRFRFRKLTLIYEGTAATATAGSVQVCYDHDAAAPLNRLSRVSTQTGAATSIGARIPFWTPRAEIPLIDEKQSSLADKTWLSTGAGVALSGTGNGALREVFQGAIAATNDQPIASGGVVGRFRWRFVLGLYGFSNYVSDGALSAVPRKELKEETVISAEPDSPVFITSPPSVRAREGPAALDEKERAAAPRVASRK